MTDMIKVTSSTSYISTEGSQERRLTTKETSPGTNIPQTTEECIDMLQALQNGDVSNDALVNNLINLLKALQSLCLSLQESSSKKALVDSEVQKSLSSMNVEIAKATKAELEEYLRQLEEYEKNKLMNDIFGVVLGFLSIVFPPLLVIYPLGPVSLFLNPEAPFGLGALGKEIDNGLGEGSSKWITLSLEIVTAVVVSVLTCGAGGAALQAGRKISGELLKKLAKEVIKDLALLGAGKMISEGLLDKITEAAIASYEKMSGEEVSESKKALIKGIVKIIAMVALVIVAVKRSSSKEGEGSIVEGLTKTFSSAGKLQKAMIPVAFVLQAAQAGIEIWAGSNTIEMARVQKTIQEIQAATTEITGISENESKKRTETLVKELQRAMQMNDIDLSTIFKTRSNTANIVAG